MVLYKCKITLKLPCANGATVNQDERVSGEEAREAKQSEQLLAPGSSHYRSSKEHRHIAKKGIYP